MDRTSVFNVAALRQELILITLNEVIESLEKKGYKAENQLVGYLLHIFLVLKGLEKR